MFEIPVTVKSNSKFYSKQFRKFYFIDFMTFFRIEQKAICQENMKVTKKSFTNFLKEMSLLDFNSQIHKRNKIKLNAKFIDQC